MIQRRAAICIGFLVIVLVCGIAYGEDHQTRPKKNETPSTEVSSVYEYIYASFVHPDKLDEVRSHLPFSRIEFERTGCLGFCPVYSLVLQRNGAAAYNGIKYVEREGAFQGEINVFDFGRLSLMIERFQVENMLAKYASEDSCASTATLRIHYANSERILEISDSDKAGPIELWAIQTAIDSIVNKIEWQLKDSDRVP
jgi:hypothetical protein